MCKLTEIQHRLKAPKGQYNSFGKYKYRSCEDILEAVKPILNDVGCFLTLSDEIQLVGDRYYIKATARLQGPDTDVTCTAYAREDLDKKGMDGSQITGTASSYARKYALNGLFCIDDTKDADTDEYANQNKKASPALSAPKSSKEMMHQNHPKWQAMLDSILAGKTTLEKVKEKYSFPDADEIAAKEWLLTHQK
jgi:hypothetical protein